MTRSRSLPEHGASYGLYTDCGAASATGLCRGFTQPTFQRWLLLLVAALLTPGRRTVTNVLRTVHGLVVGYPSSYYRVFSHRRWSAWRLSRTLTTFILTYWASTGPVVLVGDDRVEEHPGRKVFGKARQVRSAG